MTRRKQPRRGGPPAFEALLLDEMFSPLIAATLAAEGFDVLAAAGHPVLAALPDPAIAAAAREAGRRLLTENVRDLAPLLHQDDPPLRILFTSSRRYPRSQRNPGPLIEAIRAWLIDDKPCADEEWLT